MRAARSKRLVFRASARDDVESAIAWYESEAGEALANQFVADLEAAYAHIAAHPGTGSPSWGHALNLPGLRHWGLKRFPYLVFYVERPEHVEVVHVLHGARDIPASLAGPDGG